MSGFNTETVVIKIPQGLLEGVVMKSRKNKEFYGFYGIPFANVPERFELPEKWEPWNGTRDGTRALDRCIQISTATKRFIGSEQCLFLQVFTPKFALPEPEELKGRPPVLPPQRHPVMIFIHGGGFHVGGGDLYGNKFLVDENQILVTINYRLAALGFLNTGDGACPGNMGMHDQLMALRWVQHNIVYFGGDKNNVTLVGNSAGSACVHLHMLSPLSTGLFSKAIMQSGTALSPWAFNQSPADKVKKLAKQLDLNGSHVGSYGSHHFEEVITKLKRLEPEAIVAQRMDYENWKDHPVIHFAPSVESGLKTSRTFLTDSPVNLLYNGKLLNEVPLILGINAHEGLYRSIPILRDSMKVKALNEHWSQELPFHLMYKKDSVNQHEEFSRQIRKFYFDGKPIVSPNSDDARKRLTNMISDRLFNYPMRKTALIHRSLLGNPENKIFLYLFDYTGHYSYCNGFEVSDTYGASHADELQYLMNQRIFYSKIMPGSEADIVIDKMVKMWTSFAKSGTPSYGTVQPWLPMPLKDEIEDDGLQFFRIGLNDGMINEPFTERMDFWAKTQNLSLVF